MSPLFLDPNKPLHTCSKPSCNGCKPGNTIVCHFTGKQLAIFFTAGISFFLLCGYAVFQLGTGIFITWIVWTLSFFGFTEIRVMCSHCPHYAEPAANSLKCWANYGSPKIWKYRPGPMSIIEKIVFFTGFLLIIGPAFVSLILSSQYLFAGIFVLLITGYKLFLRFFYCKKCMNFACPFNVVDKNARELFFENNPVVKDAWKQ